MRSTQELLDGLRALAGSDRKASALVGVSQPVFSEWRTGKTWPSDERAARIAELLQLDAAYVLAVVNGERAKSKETRATWRRMADAFAKAAGIAAVAVAPALTSPDAQARFDSSKNVPTPAHQDGGRNTQCPTSRRRAGSAFALAVRALLLPGAHFAL